MIKLSQKTFLFGLCMALIWAVAGTIYGCIKEWSFYLCLLEAITPGLVFILLTTQWWDGDIMPPTQSDNTYPGKVPANVRRWTRRQLHLNLWGKNGLWKR